MRSDVKIRFLCHDKFLPSAPPTSLKQTSTTQADVPDRPANNSSETESRVSDIETAHGNGPIARKEEVSAEVPKFGVSGESHRASDFEIPTFEKDKA